MKSAMRVFKYGTVLDRFLKVFFVAWFLGFGMVSYLGWQAWGLLEDRQLSAEWAQVKDKAVRLASL